MTDKTPSWETAEPRAEFDHEFAPAEDLCEACAEPIAAGYESPNNDSANGLRFCEKCTFTLSGAEADAITDYDDLRLSSRDAALFPEDDTRELSAHKTETDDDGSHEYRVPERAEVLTWKHEHHDDRGNPARDAGPVWVDGIPLAVTTWADDGTALADSESVVWYERQQAESMAKLLGAQMEEV